MKDGGGEMVGVVRSCFPLSVGSKVSFPLIPSTYPLPPILTYLVSHLQLDISHL